MRKVPFRFPMGSTCATSGPCGHVRFDGSGCSSESQCKTYFDLGCLNLMEWNERDLVFVLHESTSTQTDQLNTISRFRLRFNTKPSTSVRIPNTTPSKWIVHETTAISAASGSNVRPEPRNHSGYRSLWLYLSRDFSS